MAIHPYTGVRMARATALENTVPHNIFSIASQTVFSEDHHSGITAVASISTFAASSMSALTSTTLITG